ncbi:MAG: SRPBCC family protein [Pseudobdellovibrio sp.]
MIKKVVSVITALILILLIIPVFLPTHFSLSRTIDIQAPVDQVFLKLVDLNEYTKWNPFPEGDPTNQESVTGTGIGSYLIWKGEKTGEGKMMISSIEPNKKIDIKMEFYKPFTGVGTVRWILKSTSNSTTELTWTFDEDNSYFKRYFGLIAESMMGPHFERGLKNFKTLIEGSK